MEELGDLDEFLQFCGVLLRHGVRFVIVGSTAAILQGSAAPPCDLEIVHEGSDSNLQALAAARTEIDKLFRTGIVATTFRASHSLDTRSGPRDYHSLLLEADDVEIATLTMKVVPVERLIDAMHWLADQSKHPKYRQLLEELEATLDERRKLSLASNDDRDDPT